MTRTRGASPRGPGFIAIGPQRSGTTWLYRNLQKHPAVWIHPGKETHYFDRPAPTRVQRAFGRAKHLRRARRLFFRSLLRPHGGHRGDLADALRFAFARRDDDWYLRRFPERDRTLTCEIAPGYFWLPRATIEHVSKLVPDTRFVCTLRNPLDWSWSAMSARLRRLELGIDDVRDEVVERWIASDRWWGNWMLEALDRWQQYVPPSRLRVTFFDRLVQDPTGHLRDVLTFLGLDTSAELIPADVAVRRHAQPYEPIPPRLRSLLVRRELDHIRHINDRFHNEWTAGWLHSAEHESSRDAAG